MKIFCHGQFSNICMAIKLESSKPAKLAEFSTCSMSNSLVIVLPIELAFRSWVDKANNECETYLVCSMKTLAGKPSFAWSCQCFLIAVPIRGH